MLLIGGVARIGLCERLSEAVLEIRACVVVAAPDLVASDLALSGPGVLVALVAGSDLRTTDEGYLQGYFESPDEPTMLRGQRPTQQAVLAARAVGEAAVKEAIVRAYAPYRTASGVSRSLAGSGRGPR